MKIAVLDVDQSHNQRVQSTLERNVKTEIVFCKSLEELVDVLNANQSLITKKTAMEKTLVDGAAMLKRTLDGVATAKNTLAGKRLELEEAKGSDQSALKAEITADIAEITDQIAKSEELQKKLEKAIAVRKTEIQSLSGKILKDEQKKVHLVLVDRSFLGNLPSDWILELRKKTEFADNKNVPVVTMGYNEEMNYIRQTMHGGISDYFVKPVDLLLLVHNVNKITGNSSDAEGKVFELATQSEVKILRAASVIKLSEFEIFVKTDSAFKELEIVEFFSESFGGIQDSKVLARCTKSEVDPNARGSFLSAFAFVGQTAANMIGMRKWLRAQYIAQKQKSE